MNIPTDLRRRESRLLEPGRFKSRYQVTPSYIERLGLETILDGHRGCVNCLQWSTDGNLLASGSDDCKVMIWEPFSKAKSATSIDTDHEGNIFSVKFMPYTNNNLVASGAADKKVQLHDVSQKKTITSFSNHLNRVKRLDVAQDCPNLIWSASEDGTVMETDIRAPPQETNVLVNLNSILGKQAEAKCVSVNQRRTEWIAIGANDPYIRVYDRRKIKAQLIEFPEVGNGHRGLYGRRSILAQAERPVDTPLDLCARYFVAGHLPSRVKQFHRENRSLHATYVTFSPDGSELLANLGGEQIYLFDMLDQSQRLLESTNFQQFINNNSEKPNKCDTSSTTDYFSRNKKFLKTHDKEGSEQVRLEGKENFSKGNFTQAITSYNVGIEKYGSPIFYGNRAAAYMKRKWDGDVYAALRDCYYVLSQDPTDVKAHLRLCRCLLEMKRPQEAQKCIEVFKACCPDQIKSPDHLKVEQEIFEALQKETEDNQKSKSKENGSNKSPELLRRHFLLNPQSEDTDSESDHEDMEEVEDPEDDTEPDRTESEETAEASNSKRIKTEISEVEKEEMKCRLAAADYYLRFCGHCNTTTDIKEANFFGSEGQYIVAGSDDGNFFCWDRNTTNIVKVMRGDEQIVNCLQTHPSIGLLATSGIDPVVKLWAALPEDGRENERTVTDLDSAMNENQRIMHTDPLEALLLGIGYRYRSGRSGEGAGNTNEGDDSDDSNPASVQCRTS